MALPPPPPGQSRAPLHPQRRRCDAHTPEPVRACPLPSACARIHRPRPDAACRSAATTSPLSATPSRTSSTSSLRLVHRSRPPRRAPTRPRPRPATPPSRPRLVLGTAPRTLPLRRAPSATPSSSRTAATSSPWSALSPAIPDAPVCLCVEPRHRADRGSELAAVTTLPAIPDVTSCTDCQAERRRRAPPSPSRSFAKHRRTELIQSRVAMSPLPC